MGRCVSGIGAIPVRGLDPWFSFADAGRFQPTHLADGAPRTEPGPGRARVPVCHTPGRPAAISMDAIGAASVTPVDAIESPFPVIRIHANALMSVLPIRIPSANTIRSRHVDPGGVQEGSRGLSEATPPEHAPRTRANPGWGSRTRASTGRHRVLGSSRFVRHQMQLGMGPPTGRPVVRANGPGGRD